MATTLIANFEETLITVRAVAETNSVKYKLNLGAAPNQSSKSSYIKVNDVDTYTNLTKNSLNVISFMDVNNPRTQSRMAYSILKTENSASDGFVSFMNSSTAPLIAIISSGVMYSNDAIDNWFKSKSSVVWPKKDLCNRFNFAYVAFYSPLNKKIIMESYHGENLLANNGVAVLETVCDTLADVGATGYSKSAVYDPTEYVSTSEYEFKRYPDNLLIAKFSDYGVIAGSTMMLSGELYQSKELVDAGLNTRLNLRWYKGNTLLDSVSITVPNTITDKWYKIRDMYSVVPADADGFIIVTARYPRNDSVVALGSIRNVSFTQVSRPDEKGGYASFGVNGIRTNNFVEETAIPTLLNLPDTKINVDNKVNIVGIKELENDY